MVSLSFNFIVQERFFFFQRCATSISQHSAVILPVITFQRYPARARPALTPWFYHSRFYHSSPFHGLPCFIICQLLVSLMHQTQEDCGCLARSTAKSIINYGKFKVYILLFFLSQAVNLFTAL